MAWAQLHSCKYKKYLAPVKIKKQMNRGKRFLVLKIPLKLAKKKSISMEWKIRMSLNYSTSRCPDNPALRGRSKDSLSLIMTLADLKEKAHFLAYFLVEELTYQLRFILLD